MKNIKILIVSFVCVFALSMFSCNQPYYEIPTLANGDPNITDISSTTVNPNPVTMADTEFTITAYLPNAHSGDQMIAQCLNKRVPENGGKKGFLPISGTEKTLTVDDNLKVSVTYSLSASKLTNPGDVVLVVFSGKNDAAQKKITLKKL